MLVPVMQVRPMRVHMLQRRVFMHMRMPAGLWQLLMIVQVMPVVMLMHVFVFLHFVCMRVPVLLAVQQNDRGDKNDSCRAMLPGEFFPQQCHREQHPPERRTGEDQLTAGGAQLLR